MTGLLIGAALLLANAFFVGAEFAIMSARRTQIEPRAAAGSGAARTTLFAMERVSVMLAACQFGITVCSLGLGAVAEPALAHLLEPLFELVGVPEDLVHTISFVIALGVVVYLHVVVGEMVPKNIAIAVPERSALLLAPPLVWVSKVLHPLIVVLNAIANGLLRLARVEPQDEVASTYTIEQVQAIVDESRKEGLLGDDLLMTEAIEFSDLQAGDVMVPIADLVSLPVSATPRDVEHAVRRTGFSRFPVGEGGKLIGYVHIKDVLTISDEQYRAPISASVIRRFHDVARGAEVEDVLAGMQVSRGHLARVLDDGHTELGVVFMEDVLEELVGEVVDEASRSPRDRSR